MQNTKNSKKGFSFYFRKNALPDFLLQAFVIAVGALVFSITSFAQAPVVVSADQPNVWTLEQAHYLIAQMHRRNLDLKAAPLKELDANTINAMNVDALKTLLSVSAEFDQSVLENNKTLRGTKEYQVNRRRELISKRDALQDNALTLTRQIAELNIAILKTEDEKEKENLEAQVRELTIVKAAVNEQLTQLNSQINSVTTDNTAYGNVGLGGEGSASGNSSQLSGAYNTVLSSAAGKVVEQFNNSAQLNASLRLENYLQMQYEILSKQLTLLRDEVGAGERLIFLEIPQIG